MKVMPWKKRVRTRLRKVSIALTLAYFATLLSGVASMLATPNSVEAASVGWQPYVWASLLILGGALSGSDLFTGRRGGELFGTPMIAGALFFWAAALFWREWHTPGIAGNGTVLGWILVAFFLFVVARWIMMMTEFREVKAKLG
jgi:hypothetical protein